MLLDAANRLEARERLHRVTDIALGFGSMEKRDSRRILSQLQRQAEIQAERRQSASLGDLEAAGITVKRVKRA